MSFMQPDVSHEEYYEVSYDNGSTAIIPVAGCGYCETWGDLEEYVEGTIDDDEDQETPTPVVKTGWTAHMHAPGYLDSTDHSAFETEVEAWNHLLDMYGTQDGGKQEDWEIEAEKRIAHLEAAEQGLKLYYIDTEAFDDPLFVPGLADPRQKDLNATEWVKGPGYRTIGGDRGDLRFDGYELDEENNRTVLIKPVLATTLDLDDDEAYDIACEVLQASFESIGLESVQ